MGNEEKVAKYIEIARVKLVQLEFAQGEHKDVLFSEARDALLLAEHITPGSGAWTLACISARVGSEALCERWLQRAVKRGMMPSKAEIKSSPYMVNVIRKAWFEKIIENLS